MRKLRWMAGVSLIIIVINPYPYVRNTLLQIDFSLFILLNLKSSFSYEFMTMNILG